MDYRVSFIAKYWAHHSQHSGYHQLISRFGHALQPLNLNSIRYTWIPGRIAVWLAKRSGVAHYTYKAFYDEWNVVRDMIKQHKRTVYHILYGDESYRYLGNMKLCRQHRLVATYHQPPGHLKLNLQTLKHIRKLDALIVVGKHQIPFFEPLLSRDKIIYVPHGVDTNVFHPASSTVWEQETKGVCVFVGMHKRDFETLRKVIEIVGAYDKYVQFILVTAKSNFSLFSRLHNVDLRAGITELELVSLYQEADLLLQPLKDTTANNAILEALACGLPIIATDTGSVRDYVNEDCAILSSERNAEAMAAAVQSLLANTQMRLEMCKHARERALQFDWSIVADQMRRVYDSLWV